MKKLIRYFVIGISFVFTINSNLTIAQVGIGTTTPKAALDIESSQHGILIPRVQLSSSIDNTTIKTPSGSLPENGTLIYNISGAGSGNNYIGKGFHFWDNGRWIGFTDADWFKRNSQEAPNNINDDIYTNGKVGIGITTPDYSLEIDGSILLRENGEFIIGNGSPTVSNAMRLHHDGTNTYFDSRGRSTLFRGTGINTGSGDTVIMNIDNASGHVAIGPSTPQERLHVQEGNMRIDTDYKLQFGEFYENTDPINFRRVNNALDVSELQLTIGDNDLFGDPAEDFFAIGIRNVANCSFIEKFKFGSTGTAFKPGGGSWSALSDKRVKKNVTPFTYGLEAINKIRPVTYKYNESAGYGNLEKEYVGIIAQEIERVLPMTVTKHKENGFDDLRKYDPTALTYALVNAVKDLNGDNEKLEAEVEKLEALAKELEIQFEKRAKDE